MKFGAPLMSVSQVRRGEEGEDEAVLTVNEEEEECGAGGSMISMSDSPPPIEAAESVECVEVVEAEGPAPGTEETPPPSPVAKSETSAL